MSLPAAECKDEAHEDAVASLLLQEIDFLALAALGSPAPSTLDGDCLSSNDLSLQGDEDNLTNTFKQQVDPHSPLHGTYPWEDSLPLPGDTSLCDEDLPEDFDLLSYAADTPDDRFLQRNETAVNFYDSFEDTVTSTLDLRSTSPGSDLSECETQFTKIKPRPKYLTDPGDNITDDCPNQPPLKMQSRRDGEPKRPKNGFIRYSIKHRAELLKLYPCKDNRSISKLLGIRWKKMTAEEKQPYV
ncbi:hypothetical protein V1264_001068 [Littorina saxatilis]|uniref:HMG box domain-containing protein n=1 Tax=Littorina saxatilis TaxID=31220 RepID=A0AAN9C0M5_9CAEN